MITTRRHVSTLGGVLAALPFTASAQAYPTRAVRAYPHAGCFMGPPQNL